MRTNQQRLDLMHARACQIRRQKERRTIAIMSVFSLILFVGLITVLKEMNVLHETIDNNGFTGSSLLDSGAGGYILVGVLSFAAAVVITVVCIKLKNKTRK
ncbi:MAG: hypothetical protein IJH43_04590 [Mogibacterium sp.]|nr:hypothetical protein [Mogibacterium sp.]